MVMYGIDVSHNQPENICRRVALDFAFVKVSGNPNSGGMKWNYVNPYWKTQARDAYERTGCVGLYHFTFGLESAEQEADFLVEQMREYVGKAVPVIDYEGPALKRGREWLRAFIRRMKMQTGVNPMVYASSSVIVEQRLSELCREYNCGIWSANYTKGNELINGYDTSGCRMNYAGSAAWQFTSHGRLEGYGKDLDLDVFFGDKSQWLAYATGGGTVQPVQPKPPAGDAGVKTVNPGAYRVVADVLRVRAQPTTSSAIVARYRRGEVIRTIASEVTVADGYVWAHYNRRGGGVGYVAMGTADGSEAYLEKA